MEKINAIMSEFKEKVEKLADRLIEAAGRDAPLGGALYRAGDNLVRKGVWEEGTVYDPEYPVRLAIIEAALEKVSLVEDDWWWDFLYQSPTRKYTSTEAEAWSVDGWKDLLAELDEFGEEDLATQILQINELKKEV